MSHEKACAISRVVSPTSTSRRREVKKFVERSELRKVHDLQHASSRCFFDFTLGIRNGAPVVASNDSHVSDRHINVLLFPFRSVYPFVEMPPERRGSTAETEARGHKANVGEQQRGDVDERQPLLQNRDAGEDLDERELLAFDKNDPENPRNWPYTRKMLNVATIASMAILSPLASSMYALPVHPCLLMI